VEDRILLYLFRKWRNVPFEGLRIFFGISFGSAVEYFNETAQAYHDHVAGRLLYPRSGEEIDAMALEDFKRDLPGARLIFDGTGLRMKSKENVTLHRILYSAYHRQTEGQIVLGGCERGVAVAQCADRREHGPLQASRPTA